MRLTPRETRGIVTLVADPPVLPPFSKASPPLLARGWNTCLFFNESNRIVVREAKQLISLMAYSYDSPRRG